jgi:recombination protein RecT
MNELVNVKSAIALQESEFSKALPAHVPVKKFVRVLQTAVSVNQNLINADRASLFASAQRAASMGLLPDGREGAIVEFGGKCNFMPMVAGILKLLRQSGQLSTIDALIVCKNDKFQYRPGLDEVPVHEPDWFGDRGDMIGVYSVARMKDGGAMTEIMSMKDIEKVRAASRSKNNGPWRDWFDQMAIKSVLRRLSKRLPSSTDIDLDAAFDDEEFSEAPAAPTPTNERKPGRPTRLQAVVDTARTPTPAADDDGVIDMPASAQPADTDPPI